MSYRIFALAVLCTIIASAAVVAQSRVGEVATTFRLIGPNDKIVVERFDDPKIENVSCYVSRAETGGVSGWVGFAEDPSRFSIACRATGPVRIKRAIDDDRSGEVVFDQRTSALFKELRVSRFLDAEKRVLVYLVWSTRTFSTEGSPFNSVTAVPFEPGAALTPPR
jgi:CreA protein